MLTSSVNNDMLNFFIKSFKPNYTIQLTHKNRIISFDKQLINDFQIKDHDTEKFVGLNAIDILTNNKHFSPEFSETVASIIMKSSGSGLCAINTSFQMDNSLTIPAIYILLIIVESKTNAGNEIKEVKIFNYIEMSRFLSNIFSESMFCPMVCLTKLFKHSVREKSIFFAFESLKSFGTFISNKTAARINQHQIANIIFPFHNAKGADELTKRFVREFLRTTGYIEYDKNRKIKELTLDVLERVTTKHLIPFNSIETNCIIQLA